MTPPATTLRELLIARLPQLPAEWLKQARCEHGNRGGGNDYIECFDCGLMWDYRRETYTQGLARSVAGVLQLLAERPAEQEKAK